MKIYLAHNFRARIFLPAVVELLTKRGHEVTSRWITKDHQAAKSPALQQENATEDLDDIERADALILFAEQYGETPARGKYVELGYALARRKRIFVVGQEKDCVFYFLPCIKQVKFLEELFTHDL